MADSALILDDEPHLLVWLGEFLEGKGLKVRFESDVAKAIEALGQEKYRLLILDLNVPVPTSLKEAVGKRGPLYEEYRGLFVAEYARNAGYRDRQVIVYSVHDVDEVRKITNRIRVTYAIKGRPRIFKEEIISVLSFDPSNM
ncbi:MAG: hypothetical protein IT475_13890 [Aquimonas sp.]|nr:hypothetical protein [Aquimonas sp.]